MKTKRKLYRFWVLETDAKIMDVLVNCRLCKKFYRHVFDSSVTMAKIIEDIESHPPCPRCKKGKNDAFKPNFNTDATRSGRSKGGYRYGQDS